MKPTHEELLEALRVAGPFEVIQGDALLRTSPGDTLRLNSMQAWAVGMGDRGASKLLRSVEIINSAIE